MPDAQTAQPRMPHSLNAFNAQAITLLTLQDFVISILQATQIQQQITLN